MAYGVYCVFYVNIFFLASNLPDAATPNKSSNELLTSKLRKFLFYYYYLVFVIVSVYLVLIESVHRICLRSTVYIFGILMSVANVKLFAPKGAGQLSNESAFIRTESLARPKFFFTSIWSLFI